MTNTKNMVNKMESQAPLIDDPGFLKELLTTALQLLLESEMREHLRAAKYERSKSRQGHRNGYKPRKLKTRVGTLELQVPQDRDGSFKTGLFKRYQRSEKALGVTLQEMYLKGVSTRKVRLITEQLSRQVAGVTWI